MYLLKQELKALLNPELGKPSKKGVTFFTLGGRGGQDRSSLHFFFQKHDPSVQNVTLFFNEGFPSAIIKTFL